MLAATVYVTLNTVYRLTQYCFIKFKIRSNQLLIITEVWVWIFLVVVTFKSTDPLSI